MGTRKRSTSGKSKNKQIEATTRKALAAGRSRAKEIDKSRSDVLRARKRAIETAKPRVRKREVVSTRRLAAMGPRGLGTLIAEGDSWFDYLGNDLIVQLEARGYDIESVAHHGDRIEEMAYSGSQLADFRRKIEKLARQGEVPKAILISGGGNDVAGDEFEMLLDHARSAQPGLNEDIVRGVIDLRIRNAFLYIIATANETCRLVYGRVIPILMHGYGNAVPDGRGVFGGFWILPGPWLEPGFRKKGFGDRLANTETVALLIKRFNDMLIAMTQLPGLENVHFIDLRDLLPNGSGYRKWWGDELHPTKKGFEAIADRFVRRIESL